MNVKDSKTLIQGGLVGAAVLFYADPVHPDRSCGVSRLRITTRARHIHRRDYFCHMAQTQD